MPRVKKYFPDVGFQRRVAQEFLDHRQALRDGEAECAARRGAVFLEAVVSRSGKRGREHGPVDGTHIRLIAEAAMA